MIKTLVDTSFLYSLYSPTDDNHAEALFFAEIEGRGFVIPDIVLPETAFLLNRTGGIPRVVAFMENFAAAKSYLGPIAHVDLRRAGKIMATYSAARLDFVDCVIMAMSERLDIKQVCTYDRRDFSIFRPKHCAYLELLP